MRAGAGAAAATIDAYGSRGLDLVPGLRPLAAVVPGAFDAWMLMLRDFGTWELADVMAPAIGYARDGYPVVPGIVAAIDGMEERFAASGRARRRPGRRRVPAGCSATCRWPTRTGGWRCPRARREARIDAARDAFYRGWVAEAVDSFFAAEDGLLSARTWPAGRPRSRRRSRSTTTGTRSARRARGARVR